MGSGYNDSLAVSRGARGKASTRTPIHFWLEVPMYEYEIDGKHTFITRTPLVPTDDDDESLIVWCERCQKYQVIQLPAEPLNQPVSNDERIAFEQDKGTLRERIAMTLQDLGFLESDSQIMELAVQFGVPVGEIKKINAGLRAPEGLSGVPDMCQAGLHEMTLDNIKVTKHGRQCLLCYRERDKQAKARSRAKKAASDGLPTHNGGNTR